MNPFADQSSAEVAEEVETERAGLVNTLDQLRENLRPENMVDEVFSQARANSSGLMDRVWSVARANPIPAALIGLGAAMLISASQRLGKPQTASTAQRDGGFRAAQDDLFDSPEPVWTAEDDWVTEQAGEPDGVRPKAGLSRLLDEQPLILAALGAAVGAAVGSALPATHVESEWMGDASESVRREANNMAREQLSQLRSSAGQTFEQMKSTAADHGVSSENLSGLVHDLGEDVRSATFTAQREAEGSQHH